MLSTLIIRPLLLFSTHIRSVHPSRSRAAGRWRHRLLELHRLRPPRRRPRLRPLRNGRRDRDWHRRRRGRARVGAAAEALRRHGAHPHLRGGLGPVRPHRRPHPHLEDRAVLIAWDGFALGVSVEGRGCLPLETPAIIVWRLACRRVGCVDEALLSMVGVAGVAAAPFSFIVGPPADRAGVEWAGG